MSEAKINIDRLRKWLKDASFTYENETTRLGHKKFRIKQGGFKVLLNGIILYDGSDIDSAVKAYNTAFADKLKIKEADPKAKKRNG